MAPISFTSPLTNGHKEELTRLARLSIEHGLRHQGPLPLQAEGFEPTLRQMRGTFVTLRKRNELRGCIGTIEARRPLVEDLVHNAYAAAFEDPRFPPLRQSEVSELDTHISVLSAPEPMDFVSQEDLLERLRPGTDGLILTEGRHRGTFLPAVWASLPDPREFLEHLKLKAGLPRDYWSDTLRIERYITESW